MNRERLFQTLQKLLELPAMDLASALQEAAESIASTLGCEKVDAFVLDNDRNSLVALGTSNTPMGRQQKSLGLDVLPIANGGKAVEVFVTGETIVDGELDKHEGEVRGIVDALKVRSILNVPLEVEGTIRGVLAAASDKHNFFGDQDVLFMKSVARWVAALTHRAELIEKQRKSDVERARQAAADEILAVLAHDFRNHLNPLRMHLELLSFRANEENRQKDVEHAGRALRSVERLSAMVTNLLDAHRLDSGLFTLSKEPIRLAEFLAGVASACTNPDVPVLVECASDLIVIADKERLLQALENIVMNGVRHSPKGKPVRVDAKFDLEGRSNVIITVCDEGPGVPPELRKSIFERAVGTSSSGLGLGLYLASKIAKAHRGAIYVDSPPGKGARFRFVLPFYEEPTVSEPGAI